MPHIIESYLEIPGIGLIIGVAHQFDFIPEKKLLATITFFDGTVGECFAFMADSKSPEISSFLLPGVKRSQIPNGASIDFQEIPTIPTSSINSQEKKMESAKDEFERKSDLLQKRILQADALEKARRIDEAQDAYNECLKIPAQEQFPILISQLIQIWTGIGFCHADRNEWHASLEWYNRVEKCLLSAIELMTNPTLPTAEESVKKWSQYIPEGVMVMHPIDFDVKGRLANIYNSIALAYDNDNQLENANDYYHRSTQLYKQLGDPTRESEVWLHQATGLQRRQQWVDLEKTAEKMLAAAENGKNDNTKLKALRLLAQSYMNQNRLQMMFEYYERAIILGRKLKDSKVSTDEDILRQLISLFRSDILKSNQAKMIEILINAEAIVNDPNLANDKVLLKK